MNQEVGVADDVCNGNIVGLHSDWVEAVEDTLFVVSSDQAPETVLKVVLVQDGEEKCTIGFLPRHIEMHPTQVQRFDGQFV